MVILVFCILIITIIIINIVGMGLPLLWLLFLVTIIVIVVIMIRLIIAITSFWSLLPFLFIPIIIAVLHDCLTCLLLCKGVSTDMLSFRQGLKRAL